MTIKITVEDTENGTTETAEIEDNFYVITAGNHYVDGFAKYANGTCVVTIKVDKP